jgi:O-antigen/teichoic acid export membrane protein
MSEPPASTVPPPDGAGHHVRAVARGGVLNLFGSVVYGVANFVLLAVLTRELGAARAGPVIVAIAVFTILSRIAELGASTGLIRTISRARALGRVEEIRPTLLAAVVPVLVLGVVFAVVVWFSAPALAHLFGGPKTEDEIARLLRALAPFLPLSAAYTVLIQGTRGFEVMWPLVWIEKVARACAMPVVVWVAVRAGGSPVQLLYAWVMTTAVASVVAAVLTLWLVRREHSRHPTAPDGPPVDRAGLARAFWVFSLPRALSQSFDVMILWFDTLFVAALVSPEAAGIYAAGTRFLLIGTFAADAIQQATAPKVSTLLAAGRSEDAAEVVQQATAWQAAIVWPTYLGVAAFASVLLSLFGPEFVRAQDALVLLSFGMLVACLGGPATSVILMGGRSRLSMINSAVALGFNVVGNLLLVPRYGITAAGAVWALTLVIASAMPALQSTLRLRISPWSRALVTVVGTSVVTVGVACVGARLLLGDTVAGLVAAIAVGGAGYVALNWRFRRSIYSGALTEGVRRGPRAPVAAAVPRG